MKMGTFVGALVVEGLLAALGVYLPDLVVGEISRSGSCRIATGVSRCQELFGTFTTFGFFLFLLGVLLAVGTVVVYLKERKIEEG